jgi:hypothetical protein
VWHHIIGDTMVPTEFLRPSVIALIQDAFWVSMALTMMFGLMVGTVLTMVLVPTFYSSIYRIASPVPSG